jgi:hypothetical protein
MTLKWKQDGYLHFAHSELGMWMIEQMRGKFILTLTVNRNEQDFGKYSSLSKAKAYAAKSNKILMKLR